MMKTARYFLALLLAMSLVATAFAQEEIGVGDTVEGEESDEVTEFEVELEEGQEISILLTADDESWDTYLEFYDEDGDLIAEDDDGADTYFDSYLEFEVEDDGTYVIRVRGFGSDTPGGDYELTVEEIGSSDEDEEEDDSGDSGDADMAIGDEIEIDTDGLDEVELTFEASEDDVVTILARPEADIDLAIQLLDPDGDEIALFDSFGNPAIIRQLLEDDGLYTIVITERNEEELDDEIEIEILEAEILSLNDGSQTVTLESNYQLDYMVFEAEEDVMYILEIITDGVPDSTLYVNLLQEGEFFAGTRASVAGVENAAFLLEFDEDGEVQVEVEYFAFGGDEIEVTISITEQE